MYIIIEKTESGWEIGYNVREQLLRDTCRGVSSEHRSRDTYRGKSSNRLLMCMHLWLWSDTCPKESRAKESILQQCFYTRPTHLGGSEVMNLSIGLSISSLSIVGGDPMRSIGYYHKTIPKVLEQCRRVYMRRTQ